MCARIVVVVVSLLLFIIISRFIRLRSLPLHEKDIYKLYSTSALYIYIHSRYVHRTHIFFVNDKVISFLMVAHGRSLCRASSSSWPTRCARISSNRVGFKFIFITLYRSLLSLFCTWLLRRENSYILTPFRCHKTGPVCKETIALYNHLIVAFVFFVFFLFLIYVYNVPVQRQYCNSFTVLRKSLKKSEPVCVYTWLLKFYDGHIFVFGSLNSTNLTLALLIFGKICW